MDVWDGIVIAETPRLLLRTFRRDDLPAYAALNADPAVVATLGGQPFSAEYSDSLAAWHQDRYLAQGYGLLAVERRSDGAFLGMCGLHHQESFPDDVELAYRLAHEHWGHGYATEAGAGWLDLAFGRFGLPRVIGIAEESNPRSLAVMRHLGMTPWWTGTVTDEDEQFEAVVHAVTAAEWQARGPQGGESVVSGG
jgi:RimJ/RimL family protein N-acetyltransferase